MSIAIEPPKLKIPGIRMLGQQLVLTCQTLDGTAADKGEISRLRDIIRSVFPYDTNAPNVVVDGDKLIFRSYHHINKLMRWLVACEYVDKKTANHFLGSHKWTAKAKLVVYLVGLVTAGLLFLLGAGSLLGYKSATSLLTKGFSIFAKSVIVDGSIASAVAFLGGVLGWGSLSAFYHEEKKRHWDLKVIEEIRDKYKVEEQCAEMTVAGFSSISRKGIDTAIQIRIIKKDHTGFSDNEKNAVKRILEANIKTKTVAREHLEIWDGAAFGMFEETISGDLGSVLIVEIICVFSEGYNIQRAIADLLVGVNLLPAPLVKKFMYNLSLHESDGKKITFYDWRATYRLILGQLRQGLGETASDPKRADGEYSVFLANTKEQLPSEKSLFPPKSFELWVDTERQGLLHHRFPMLDFIKTVYSFCMKRRSREHKYEGEVSLRNITFYDQRGIPIRMVVAPSLDDLSWTDVNLVPARIQVELQKGQGQICELEDLELDISSLSCELIQSKIDEGYIIHNVKVYNKSGTLLETREVGSEDLNWISEVKPKQAQDSSASNVMG